MMERNRLLQALRQVDVDLWVQYEELLRLRAEVAKLRFPLRKTPARRRRTPRRDVLSARAVQFNERRASSPAAVVLLRPEHHT